MTQTLRIVAAAPLLLAGCRADEPSSVLRVSGQVEATEVHIAAEVSGRIVELRVAEGDRVMVGEVVARLDTRDTELRIQRTRAERAGAVAQLRLLEAGPRSEDIRQAEAQVDVSGAEVKAIEAELNAAELDLQRFEALLRPRRLS